MYISSMNKRKCGYTRLGLLFENRCFHIHMFS